MQGTFFDNLDMDLYLTQEEFNIVSLPKLEVVNGRLKERRASLECMLQNMDGSDCGRRAHLQGEDFEEMGDGIRVDYSEGTYFVRMNGHAADIIAERGHFGTRYGMGEKITISISERVRASR